MVDEPLNVYFRAIVAPNQTRQYCAPSVATSIALSRTLELPLDNGNRIIHTSFSIRCTQCIYSLNDSQRPQLFVLIDCRFSPILLILT